VANFDRRATFWTILVDVHDTMYHAIYLTIDFSIQRRSFNLKFLLYIHIRETFDPLGGANFDTRGKI
jgi:hypothetical protein